MKKFSARAVGAVLGALESEWVTWEVLVDAANELEAVEEKASTAAEKRAIVMSRVLLRSLANAICADFVNDWIEGRTPTLKISLPGRKK